MAFNLGAVGELAAEAEQALYADFKALLARYGAERSHFHGETVVDSAPHQAPPEAPADVPAPAPDPAPAEPAAV